MNFLQKLFSAKDVRLPVGQGSASDGKKEEVKTAKKTDKESDKKIVSAPKQEEARKIAPEKFIAGVIRSPRITEKTSALVKENKYVFLVNSRANKVEIARAVRARYGVDTRSVNIVNIPGKERRRGRQIGWKPGFKKAIVKVKEGQSIEIQ